MLRAASGILRRATFKPTLSKNPLGASIMRRGFSSIREGGFTISPLNGALFGIGTAGLLYLMIADGKPTPAQSSTFNILAVNRAKQALAYFGMLILIFRWVMLPHRRSSLCSPSYQNCLHESLAQLSPFSRLHDPYDDD